MNPICKQCGKVEVEVEVEVARTLNTSWSLPAVWLADAAEILGHVRHVDGAPKGLTPDVLLDLVRELHDDRDYWRQRAESAECARRACEAAKAGPGEWQ